MTTSTTLCTSCGATLSRGAAFCHACGAPVAGGAAGPRDGRVRRGGSAWVVSGVVVAISLIAIAWALSRPSGAPAAPPAMAGAADLTGRAPDISNLTPRQSFDRLYNRVMMAAEQGDSATVVRFTAHGLSAYAQLDSVDADARYHAAILHAQVAQYGEALALADTILAGDPGHLLGFLIRGTVAELRADQAALAAARRDFLVAWDRDPRRDRAEYLDHQAALDDFRKAAGAP